MRQAEAVYGGDPNFAAFPESTAGHVSGLLALPLYGDKKLTGILTLARKNSRTYGTAEIEAVGKMGSTLVVAMREMDRQREVDALRDKLRTARRENTLLEKRLAERKLVERAKGLLQVHHQWSEEDAYYHIRRTSRQQRTPMAVIAQRVIDRIAGQEMDRERLSA
jgi:hypothetical protein